MKPHLSILMTCFNRKDTTIACLGALPLACTDQLTYTVFLVDDGSSDGTPEAVARLFPEVRLVRESGDLFWNRGVHRAWREALVTPTDYYLWLNDDLAPAPGILKALVDYSTQRAAQYQGKLIVVGRTLSAESHETTYGGYKRREGISRLRFRRLREDEIACDTMNGNCVLIPNSAPDDIGLNDPRYSHAFGDVDYGLRAVRAGYTLLQMPEPVGFQEFSHDYKNAVWKLTMGNARFVFTHPKGIPLAEWYAFCRTNGGPLWPVNFGLRYFKMLFAKDAA
jgi:GT2 family glycosyltransferase